MRTHLFSTAIVVGAAILSAGPAQAASFVEAAGGDYPGSLGFGGSVLGTLDPGVNTVQGSLSGVCTNTEPVDCNLLTGDSQDSFLFRVAADTWVHRLSITVSGLLAPAGFSLSLSLDLPAGVGGVFASNVLSGDPVAPNLLVSNLGEGLYGVSVFGQSADASGPYLLNYAVQMDVSAVPEPMSLGLMVAGLGGLGGLVGVRRLRSARV